jgi:hypothetical protein
MKASSSYSAKTRETITEYLKHSLKPKKGYKVVTLRLPKRLNDSVDTYLSSTGLEDSEGIATLIEFGLGLSKSEEFSRIEDEIGMLKELLSESNLALGEKKLEAYENLLENKALAAELASLLSENRILRKRLTTHNLPDNRWTALEHEDEVRKAELFLSKYTFKPRL